jgi:hypothetical protein
MTLVSVAQGMKKGPTRVACSAGRGIGRVGPWTFARPIGALFRFLPRDRVGIGRCGRIGGGR